MDYEQRMRLRARLQRCGMPAALDEIVRLGEVVDRLSALVVSRQFSVSGDQESGAGGRYAGAPLDDDGPDPCERVGREE